MNRLSRLSSRQSRVPAGLAVLGFCVGARLAAAQTDADEPPDEAEAALVTETTVDENAPVDKEPSVVDEAPVFNDAFVDEKPAVTEEGVPDETTAVEDVNIGAHAKPEPPDLRFIYRTTNVFRWNPLGLMSDNHVGVRRRLVRSDNLLLADTFAGIGFTPVVTGAFARFGMLAEVQPLSIMRLWAAYDVVGYYGIFSLFQSFPGPSSDFSDSQIASLGQLEPGDPRRNYANIGTQLTLGLDLQIKLGPIAARNFSRAVRGSFPMRSGDTVYYDQTYDVLAPNDGFFFSNDTDLFWVFDFGLVIGVRANTTYAIYQTEAPSLVDVAGAALPHNPNGPTLRAGPMITYTFFDDPGSFFNRPTLILITHMHMLHRWRTGADNPIWMPYVVVGFQMQGDLKPWG